MTGQKQVAYISSEHFLATKTIQIIEDIVGAEVTYLQDYDEARVLLEQEFDAVVLVPRDLNARDYHVPELEDIDPKEPHPDDIGRKIVQHLVRKEGSPNQGTYVLVRLEGEKYTPQEYLDAGASKVFRFLSPEDTPETIVSTLEKAISAESND